MPLAGLLDPSRGASLGTRRRISLMVQRVAEWEAGTCRPTVSELRKAAQVYGRPLGVFVLPEPPEDFETLRDFRRVSGSPAAEWSAALHEEYRRAHAQRGALLEVAADFDVVPVIMLNGKDWPRGRLFSGIHEYAHLLPRGRPLGQATWLLVKRVSGHRC